MLPLHLWLPGLLNRVVPLSTGLLEVTEQLCLKQAPKELAKSMDITVRLAWFLPHFLMLWDFEGPTLLSHSLLSYNIVFFIEYRGSNFHLIDIKESQKCSGN